jgi:hypothetical protein
VKLHVDGWDPGYGSGFEPGESRQSAAKTVLDVERPTGAWQPLDPPRDTPEPAAVLLVDGVRRIDAGMWLTGADGVTYRGVAVSFAAGVVRCDRRRGAAEILRTAVRRGLFSPSPEAPELAGGAVRYTPYQTGSDDPGKLNGAVQAQLRALEVGVSEGDRTDDDLLVVDGPLHHGRRSLPRALGYAKTQTVEYLPDPLVAVVTGLGPGQRTPLFRIDSPWPLFAWYLRLPGGPGGGPRAGIVRVECSAELPVDEAVALADRSAATLPRFASTAYKDPRAPQNLVPIAGLERRLRAMLGDPRLLYRALVLASRRETTAA